MPSELSQTLNGSYIMVPVLKVNMRRKPNFQLDCMARPPHRAARFGERNKRQGHAARHGALSPVLRHPILSARPLFVCVTFYRLFLRHHACTRHAKDGKPIRLQALRSGQASGYTYSVFLSAAYGHMPPHANNMHARSGMHGSIVRHEDEACNFGSV
jgi:hypothetical protein